MGMQKCIMVSVLLVLLFSCKGNKQVVLNYESEHLRIEQLSPHTFMHVSYIDTEKWGKVGCNGMVVVNDNEAIVFDTPTDNLASVELVKWIQKTLESKITAVVATHFHEDCLGGLDVFHENQIPSYGLDLTLKLAHKQDKTIPQHGFDTTMELNVGNEKIICKYLGEGHTSDNIVGYYPAEKVLFGGCLIKSDGASKGNLEDANVNSWSTTVEEVKSGFQEVEVVIPGHGKAGNSDLLDYTIQLFKQD